MNAAPSILESVGRRTLEALEHAAPYLDRLPTYSRNQLHIAIGELRAALEADQAPVKQGAPMSAISTIASLMPLVKSAADVLATFRGTTQQLKASAAVQDAAEFIVAVAPLVDSFRLGVEVTESDVRAAIGHMDDALAEFDAEIAKQEQANP